MSLPLVRSILGAATLAGLLAAPLHVAAYDGLVVFGDSLSDSGRLYAMTSNTVPAWPYWQGRFSSGPVAVEHLASGLGLSSSPNPYAVMNFAVGGATTGTSGALDAVGVFTGMQSQVGWYQSTLSSLGQSADSDALFVVWGGANDLRRGDTSSPAAVLNLIDTTVDNLGGIVETLYGMGARHFLLPNMPDLGRTPEAYAAEAQTPGASAAISFVSGLFNSALAAEYARIDNLYADIDLRYVDTMASQLAVIADPLAYGLTNVTDGCFVAPSDGNPASYCGTPSTYLYFDNIHPSDTVHGVLGAQMLAAAVPEPATVLTMGLGVLALLGVSARRRLTRG